MSFTSFNFIFDLSGGKGSPINSYLYSFEYTSLTGPGSLYSITAYINEIVVFTGDFFDDDKPLTKTIRIDDIDGNRQYFTQGIKIDARLVCTTDSISSSNIYGVFQRQTDATNIVLNTQLPPITIASSSSNTKSVILPPIISPIQYTSLYFKYLGGGPFSICPYMSNLSYPIRDSVFTTTSSAYSGIFDSQLVGAVGPIQTTNDASNSAITLFTNGTNWFRANAYNPGFLTLGSSSDQTGALVESSNSQVLFYNYTTTRTQSTIVVANTQSSLIKYIFVRNTSGSNGLIMRLFTQPDKGFDTQTVPTGESGYIEFTLNNGQQRTVGVLCGTSSNKQYILSDFDSTGINNVTGVGDPAITLSTTVGVTFITSTIGLLAPIQQIGVARMNSLVHTSGAGMASLVVTAPLNNSSNRIFIPGDTISTTYSVSLAHTANFNYTFATFYNGTASNSVTIPLYRSVT